MIYHRELLNRETGELETISLGDWITIAELGELYGFGRRQTTEVLRRLDVLQVEIDHRTTRHRLAPWFVDRGYGMRQKRKCDKYPFDVIGPDGQKWIAEVWDLAAEELYQEKTAKPVEAARHALNAFQADRDKMSVQMEVCWLADHFPSLTQKQMALVISVSQPLVNRNLKARQRHIQKRVRLRDNELPHGKGLYSNRDIEEPNAGSSVLN